MAVRPVHLFWGAVVSAIALLLGTIARGWPKVDEPLTGACARLSIGTLLGAVAGGFYSRGLPPGLAAEVLLCGLALGGVVGFLWGVVWYLAAPRPRT